MTSDPSDGEPTSADEADDLDGFRTPLTRFRDRGLRWVAVLAAFALVLPAGWWLVDEVRFRIAGAAVIQTLAGEMRGREIADTVLLVQVTECDPRRRGSGSAFVVELPDGPRLVTNRHVVDTARTVGVRTLDGSAVLPIAGVRVSDAADVAVLEVEDSSRLPPALRLAEEVVDPGQDVRIVGFPAATPFTTSGTVAAVSRGSLLLDLEVDPGASGSPVVDEDGRVVGQVFGITRDGYGVATSAAELVAAAGDTRHITPC